MRAFWLSVLATLLSGIVPCRAAEPFLVFEPHGKANGKNIVLVGGDEEYRSEELLPQLAKILSMWHGFRCTVLFSIDPNDSTINPDRLDNIPGLEALDTADLMVILTRFRNLPDDQMKHIADYIESGKPIAGIRTATHAFALTSSPTFAKYNWNNSDGAASDAWYWAKRGSGTMVSTESKARLESSTRRRPRIPSSPAFNPAKSGAKPTSMKRTCRFLETAARCCSARCSQAWTQRTRPSQAR